MALQSPSTKESFEALKLTAQGEKALGDLQMLLLHDAVERVDQALKDVSRRGLVSTAEMIDSLLDIRQVVQLIKLPVISEGGETTASDNGLLLPPVNT